MTTGERIKKIRKGMKMSQEELASKTGYSDRSSIAKIETNKAELSENKLKIFAQVLNVSVSDLLGISLRQQIADNREEYKIIKNKLNTSSEEEKEDIIIKLDSLNEKYYDMTMEQEFSSYNKAEKPAISDELKDLTDSEKELLNLFRKLPATVQQSLFVQIEALAAVQRSSEKLQ